MAVRSMQGGGGDMDCGSAGRVCFEQEEATSDTWAYLGPGRGSYEKVQNVTYVGEGLGSYGRERIVRNGQCRWSCLLCIAFILLACVAAAVWWLIVYNQGKIAVDPVIEQEITFSAPYDCDDGYWNWQQAWNSSKAEYCCTSRGRGCPTSSSSHPFDCNANLVNGYVSWSESKKQWCCARVGRGCPTTTSHNQALFNCHIGQYEVANAWDVTKRMWCCDHYSIGCGVPGTSEPYDCSAGFRNWEAGWSGNKKTWCCANKNMGCARTAVVASLPYDCDAGYSNWQAGWSSGKKQWCCAHSSRGCATPVSPTLVTDMSKPYDCNAALGNFHRAWSAPKKKWCCQNEQKGCDGNGPPQQTAGPGMYWKHVNVDGYWTWEAIAGDRMASDMGPAYDCQAGLGNFHLGWAASKKSWCCEHDGLGCDGPSQPAFPAKPGTTWKRVQENGFWTWKTVAL